MRAPAVHRRPSGNLAPTEPAIAPRSLVPHPPTRSDIAKLAGLRAGGGLVISLYVDLDPSRFGVPGAREAQVQEVIDQARADATERWHELHHAARLAFDSDLKRAHRHLLEHRPTAGIRGVALFASTPAELFTTFTFDVPVASHGHAGDHALLRPLFELAPQASWALLAIDRRHAVIYAGRGVDIREVASFESHTRGHHERSGAEQARVERVVVHDTAQHARRAAERLFRHYRVAHFDALLLACGDEIRPVVEEHLHPDVRHLLLGRVPWDPELRPEKLAALIAPQLEARERRAEEAILDRLQAEIGRDAGAVGLPRVLEALNRRAVDTLVFEPGMEASGTVCPVCGWLAATATACRACGAAMVPRADLCEDMLRAAVDQSAEVHFLRFAPAHPGEPAHVAAVVRPGMG